MARLTKDASGQLLGSFSSYNTIVSVYATLQSSIYMKQAYLSIEKVNMINKIGQK